jgi:hypothetical protein
LGQFLKWTNKQRTEKGDSGWYNFVLQKGIKEVRKMIKEQNAVNEMTAEQLDQEYGETPELQLFTKPDHPVDTFVFDQMLPPHARVWNMMLPNKPMGELSSTGKPIMTQPKTLILGGYSNTCKTAMAKALAFKMGLDGFYVASSVEDLLNTKLKPNTLLILDDWDLSDVSTQKQAMKVMCRQEKGGRTVKVRNTNVFFPPGIAMVITCNELSLESLIKTAFPKIEKKHFDAIARRVVFVECKYCFSKDEQVINAWWDVNKEYFHNVMPPNVHAPPAPGANHHAPPPAPPPRGRQRKQNRQQQAQQPAADDRAQPNWNGRWMNRWCFKCTSYFIY